MAYREVGMWEILNVLRRIGRGESKTAVRRATGHTRRTIRRYVAVAEELGWVPGSAEADEALARAVYERLRPVRKDEKPGETEGLLLPHKERMEAWLKGKPGQRGLRLSKVHQLLRNEGLDVPYSSLHRFAVKHCGFSDKRRLTVRIAECAPGEVAQGDFGRLGLIPCPETGRRRLLHALVVTLVYSRHQYVHVTHCKKLPSLIEGLEDTWEFFGGVTLRLILDNLRAAVVKADRYDPVFQRTFEDYAQYRGFIIDAAVVRHPTGKPHVERNIQYVRESFFRGETWRDRDHVQREAIRWCIEVAGQRIHGTTRKRPLTVFENVEKAALKPLIRERFDPPEWKECKVHPDHHVSFLKALYSVPTAYVRGEVSVRGDSKLVRIYAKGQLVKTHPRKPPGGRSTDYDDYPKEVAPYAMRDPDRMCREAREQGRHVGRFMEKLLAGPFPWSKLRQAQKLLRLGNKYGFERVDGACRRALAFEVINVKRVEAIIEQGLDALDTTPSTETRPVLVLRPARFARPAESFSHQPAKGDEYD